VIVVSAGAASHLNATGAPSSTTAGTVMHITVTAEDPFNNTDTGYTGTVVLSSTDSAAVFAPPAGTLVSGVGTFNVTLKTAGHQTLTAADSVAASITAGTRSITVAAGSVAHLAISGTPGTTSAGTPFRFTVTAEDQFNNAAAGYSSTVEFSTSDSGTAGTAVPPHSALVSGVGTFSATLTTAGSQTLSAADTVSSSISGSAVIDIAPLAATHFLVSYPATDQAGHFVFGTVTAEDRFNNVDINYAGTIQFTSSDAGAALPDNSTLTLGTGSGFGALLVTAGQQTVTVTDTVDATLTGTSNTITVNPGAAKHFAITAPASAIAGTGFTFTVTAQDQFFNTVTNYPGTVVFSSSDPSHVTPQASTLVSGVGVFSATLNTQGSQTLTATDSANATIVGASNAINVLPTEAAATHFVVNGPSNTTAGGAFTFTVTAETAANLVATAYSGTVTFTSTDSQASLSPPGTLLNGQGIFAGVLKTAGSQTITASDTVNSSITGTTTLTVSPTAAVRFVLIAPLPSYPGVISGPTSFASTGVPLPFTIKALDQDGNVDPTYSGTVQFSSTDTAAGLPANSTLSSGVGVFSATLGTPGTRTLTATDTAHSFISGVTGPLTVRGLVVTGFTAAPDGFSVSFNKPFNPNTVNLYTAASLPDSVMLATTSTQVSIRGSVVYNTPTSPTSFTFVKTNGMSSVGTFNPAVGLLAAGNYTVTLRSFTAGSSGFEDSLGGVLDGNNSGVPGSNFLFTFSVSPPPVAVGLPDFARGPSNTDAIFLPTTIGNGGTFSLSYTNPSATPQTGTATITFSTTAATLLNNIQTALSITTNANGGLAEQIGITSNTPNSAVVVLNDRSTGANVLVTFQNTLASATTHLLSSSTPGVSISVATVNLPNTFPGSGIPIALSNGQNVTSGMFTLEYNSNVLQIASVVPSPAISSIPGATFSLVSNIVSEGTGTAVLSLSSPSSISSTSTSAIILGSLLATVPISATGSYGAKQLLHFSSEKLNGTSGPIAITNEDGVEVTAYLGDAGNTGAPFNLHDAIAVSQIASAIANTITQTIPGFSAWPNLDPAIIGDVTLQGNVTFGDATLMNQQLVSARSAIPFAPIGLPITSVGPDPTLSLERMKDEGGRMNEEQGTAPASSFILHPSSLVFVVNIDTAHPAGSTGLTDAILALQYDPALFDVSAADVRLGTVPAAAGGWQLQTEVNAQTGLIGIELASNTPIQSTAGGSLVTITLHEKATALSLAGGAALSAPLTIVPFVDPAGSQRVYQTSLQSPEGALVWHVAATSPGINAEVPLLGSVEALPVLPADVSFIKQETAPRIVSDGAVVQPAAIFAAQPSEEGVDHGIRDLALLQASAVSGQTAEWLPDEFAGWLSDSERVGGSLPVSSPGAKLAEEGAEADGLDEFFAREGSGFGPL
jgi:hypothetical protein